MEAGGEGRAGEEEIPWRIHGGFQRRVCLAGWGPESWTMQELTKIVSRYFNTVGSKEGWTPSTFVSSRTNRRKDDAKSSTEQRAEDFMDEEDLADAEESRRIQTTAAFAGLGSTQDDVSRTPSLMGLFRPEGETMGVKLLKKMGWREGQGIGPKIRRTARLELRTDTDTYLFAPENVPMIRFTRKTDHKGLGYAGEARLAPLGPSTKRDAVISDDDDEDGDGGAASVLGRPSFSISVGRKKDKGKPRGGMGIGILNDTGSDDEDPYEIGPRISYNRVVGGDRKKKKPAVTINPTLKTKPTFMPKKASLGKVALGARKCHDGRLPLEGFVFGKMDDPLTATINSQGKYPPPEVPADWVSSKKPPSQGDANDYVSAAEAAKASTLDPKARAALLGEKQLPGKSVFDFMSAAARARLVAATGRADLPPALGEVPAGFARSDEERNQELLSRVPKLDKESAVAALSRGTGVGAPYADNDAKRSRYRAYLETQAGFRPSLPPKPTGMNSDEWLREFNEFFNCARIFKPMTGFMASRFTTSSSATGLSSGSKGEANGDLVSKPPPKPQDPAEEAAKLGMFGTLTRSVVDFYPTRLLCKRFNVKPPALVQPDSDVYSGSTTKADFSARSSVFGDGAAARPDFTPGMTSSGGVSGEANTARGGVGETSKPAVPAQADVIDSATNEALEGTRAGEEVFKAIFGDSDNDE